MKQQLKSISLVLFCLFAGLAVLNAQIKVKDLLKKGGKTNNASKEKEIGVEITEDAVGISGTYYVWQPEVEDGFFKKMPKVAIQYNAENGKLTLYASKKEFLEYRTADFVRTYKMVDRCGEYGFDDPRRVGPYLYTNEPGVFMYSSFNSNSQACEFTDFKVDKKKSYVMSKDKAYIEGMTLEKFHELLLSKKTETCNCYRDWRSGADPVPPRKLKDAAIEAEALKLIKQTAQKQGWTEEILGVYIASEKWGDAEVWRMTGTNELNSAERMNMVVLMKKGNNCTYQRFVIANNNWNLGENGSTVDKGISIAGTVPENKHIKCEQAAALLAD